MKNHAINLDETQVREVYYIPEKDFGYWTFTMEACLLPRPLGKAVLQVFETLPSYIQHALTFTPERGGWAARAQFWKAVLRPQLPPTQYHQAMQKFIGGYARNVRRQPTTEGRAWDYDGIRSEFICESYRRGIAGEEGTVCSLAEELEALSQEVGKPVEELRANQGLCNLIELVNRAYEDGAKLSSPIPS